MSDIDILPDQEAARDPSAIRLLVVDSEIRALSHLNGESGTWEARFEIEHCRSVDAALSVLAARPFDAILVAVPTFPPEALRAVQRLSAAAPGAAIIALGAAPEREIALDLLRAGAGDYVLKGDRSYPSLPRIISYAVQRKSFSARVRKLAHHQTDVEALLSAVLQAVQTPLAILNARDQFMVTNPAMSTVFGWKMREFSGQSIASFVVAPPNGGTTLVRCQDGSERSVNMVSMPVQLEERLCRVVTFEPLAPSPEAEARIRRSVNNMVEQRSGQLVAGQVQMVSVAAIRARLGSRWEQVGERIYAIAEAVIRTRLAPEDVFSRNDRGEFILCFGSLDESGAWYKAKAIQKEIHERLLGEDLDDQLAGVRVEVQKLALTAADVAEAGDISALIAAKLAKAADDLKHDADALLQEISQTCALRLQPLLTSRGTALPLAIAVFDPDTQTRLDRLAAAVDDPGLEAQINILLVGRVVQALVERLDDPKQTCVIVPLSFSTLYQRGTRERLLSILRQIPPPVRKYLGWSIGPVPDDVGPMRATELSVAVAPFARLLMLRLARPALEALDLSSPLAKVISLDYGAIARGIGSRAVHHFLGQVHASGSRLLVTGIPSQKAADRLAEAGVDMMAFS